MNHSLAAVVEVVEVAVVVELAEAAGVAVPVAVAAHGPVAVEEHVPVAAPRVLRRLLVVRHRFRAAARGQLSVLARAPAGLAREHPRAHVPRRDPRQALVPALETSPVEGALTPAR